MAPSQQKAQRSHDPLTQLNIPVTTLPLWQRLLKHASSITIEKVLHLPRQLSAVNLDIDLKVADRTQPVQVSSTQRDPLTINRARLRMRSERQRSII